MKALLLCAGHGKRFKPHTDQLAKPSLPFLNLPMIAYPAFHLKDLGLSKLFINTHHLPETVKQSAEVLTPLFKNIEFSDEQPEILDSAGAIDKLKDELSKEDHFLVVNGDALFFSENPKLIDEFVEQHKKDKAIASFMTCSQPGAGTEFSAMWVDNDNHYRAVGKDIKDEGLTPQHFAGVYCLSSEIFNWIPSSQASHILLDVVAKIWQEEGFERTRCYHKDLLGWFETGNLASYIEATQTCLESVFEYQQLENPGLGKAVSECLETYNMLSNQQFYREGESLILSTNPLSQEVLMHCKGFNVFGGEHSGKLTEDIKNCVLNKGCVLPSSGSQAQLIL